MYWVEPGLSPPSDKITLAYIGTGTQGLREMLKLLAIPEIQIVAVCDPCKDAVGYRDWARDSLLKSIRNALGKPDWRAGSEGVIPGGRDVAKDIVETYYATQRPGGTFKGCSSYADFRELLDKEKDVDAVKIMTPDHLHGVISIAAMKRGKHVIMHKPIANRLEEARLVIDTAREKGVATHFMPWDSNGSMDQVMAWINDGSIGTLREVHNWTNRPVWPQYTDSPHRYASRSRKALTGICGWVPRPPVPITRITRTWYFADGMTSEAAPWRIWAITACGRSSMPWSWGPHQCRADAKSHL